VFVILNNLDEPTILLSIIVEVPLQNLRMLIKESQGLRGLNWTILVGSQFYIEHILRLKAEQLLVVEKKLECELAPEIYTVKDKC
jgi:hypothetical protein